MRKKSKEDRTSKLWKNLKIRLIAVRKQNVSEYMKRIKLFLFLPYNKHLINRTKSVCMGES